MISQPLTWSAPLPGRSSSSSSYSFLHLYSSTSHPLLPPFSLSSLLPLSLLRPCCWVRVGGSSEMKREHHEIAGGGGGYCASPEVLYSGGEKGKMSTMEQQDAAEVDELLAALGYKVRSSDMADVALKMEQLEMAMASGSSSAADDAMLAHLATDAVHYNPSDLSSWIESLLSEVNLPPPTPPPPPPPTMKTTNNHHHFDLPPLPESSSSTITTVDNFPDPSPAPKKKKTQKSCSDLKLPVPASRPVYSPNPARERKRIRSSSSSSSSPAAANPVAGGEGGLQVVVVDSQEAGIRLVHVLMACAEAVQLENLPAADALVKQVSGLAASQGGAMRKVAGYFAEALARRIYRIPSPATDRSDILQMQNFYEISPYLKFAHFTANQAILDAFSGRRRVHVVDLGMNQGLQWPALLQALALRPGGPPSFRLTGVAAGDGSAMRQVGWKLSNLAAAMGVEFEFRCLDDLDPLAILAGAGEGEDEEAVAVNSVFELHRILARNGAAEEVLGKIRAVRPRIFTVVEQEARHNSGAFLERFTEALHYYSTMFDSLEIGGSGSGSATAMSAEVYLGRQICNVVGSEGEERTERHETLDQWRRRLGTAGFQPVNLGSNAFRQASALLAGFFSADGAGAGEYRVEEREGCLTLGWHTRPLVATSAWCVSDLAPPPLAGSGDEEPRRV